MIIITNSIPVNLLPSTKSLSVASISIEHLKKINEKEEFFVHEASDLGILSDSISKYFNNVSSLNDIKIGPDDSIIIARKNKDSFNFTQLMFD